MTDKPLQEHIDRARGCYIKTRSKTYYPIYVIPTPLYKKQRDFAYNNVVCVIVIRTLPLNIFARDAKFYSILNKEILSKIDVEDKAYMAYIFSEKDKSIITDIEKDSIID